MHRKQTQVTDRTGSESTLEVPTVREGSRGSRTRNSKRGEREKRQRIGGKAKKREGTPLTRL